MFDNDFTNLNYWNDRLGEPVFVSVIRSNGQPLATYGLVACIGYKDDRPAVFLADRLLYPSELQVIPLDIIRGVQAKR